MSGERAARGWDLASVSAIGATLDVQYPELNLGEAPTEADRPNHNFGTLAHDEIDTRGIHRVPVFVISRLDKPINNAADAYLKLHLVSMRMTKPDTLSLDGIFAQFANVVWTNCGPFTVEDFTLRKADVERASTEATPAFASQARLPVATPATTVNVFDVDKFPRMVDYVILTGVRLGDANHMRLGAYLSSDTTVMHAEFVNFNAGTLGVSMVENRASQGVIVGDGSDTGDDASIMDTLSGGDKLRSSTDEHSLLGTNAGIGISLGDNCTVKAGLYITAGTEITIWDKTKTAVGEPLKMVKGAEFSGKNDILFIRSSMNGCIEARYRKVGIELNARLHKN